MRLDRTRGGGHDPAALNAARTCTGLLIVAGPANAAPPERSPLEAPEPVRTVNLHLTGSDMLDDLAEAGVDLSSGPTRVPTGIEVEAVVSDSEAVALERIGADVLPKSENFEWSFRQTRAFGAPFGPGVQTHETTVRVVRADWFTTKGQGFLYVEARTTEGAQTDPVVTMQLENDSGEGTGFGFPRAMSRFIDSGEYMFHRNLFKLAARPSQIRVTSSTGGVATGLVSDWLEDVEPLTADPQYQWDFVDGYRHPQQLYSRFEEIARQYPNIAQIVDCRTGPTATSARRRRRSAASRHKRGGGQLGGMGPRGRERHHRRARAALRVQPAARGRGRRQGRPRTAGQGSVWRAGQHGGRRRGRAPDAVGGPHRPRARVPDQRRHRDRPADARRCR